MALHALPGTQQSPSFSPRRPTASGVAAAGGDTYQPQRPLRAPAPPRAPLGWRLYNRKVVRPWPACKPEATLRVRRCVYEGAAWKLIGGAGALRPGVPALRALQPWPERWPEKVPLVPRLPDWLAAGDLGPPGVDMVPRRGSVFVTVSRPKVNRDLEEDSRRLQRPVTLVAVVNERTDRLGIFCADATPRPGDKAHLWLRVWTRCPHSKQGLRNEIQHVLNERWGRNRVGKVELPKG